MPTAPVATASRWLRTAGSSAVITYTVRAIRPGVLRNHLAWAGGQDGTHTVGKRAVRDYSIGKRGVRDKGALPRLRR